MVAGYIEYPLFKFLWSSKKNKYIEYSRPSFPPNLSNPARFFYSNSN